MYVNFFQESKRAAIVEEENEAKVAQEMSGENMNFSDDLSKPTLENCEETSNEKDSGETLSQVELEKPMEGISESEMRW